MIKKCPVCGKEMLMNQKRSEKAPDYICSDPDCKFSYVNGQWVESKFRTGIWEKRDNKTVRFKDKNEGIEKMFKEKQENIKGMVESKQEGIRASVALNNAVLFYQNAPERTNGKVLEAAGMFYDWLAEKAKEAELSVVPFKDNEYGRGEKEKKEIKKEIVKGDLKEAKKTLISKEQMETIWDILKRLGAANRGGALMLLEDIIKKEVKSLLDLNYFEAEEIIKMLKDYQNEEEERMLFEQGNDEIRPDEVPF